MMLLTDLADVVRQTGLPVVEVPGWRSRGHGQFESIETITCHHTAGPPDSRTSSDYPSLGTVRDGRPGLDGPLAQLGLGFAGTVYVIAAGVCWHTGATFYRWQNNWHSIGIEAEHPGGSAPWPPDQYNAYVLLCRTLGDAYGVPDERVLGHKEVAAPLGRKPDPTFDMNAFRRAVAATPPPTGKDDDMTPFELLNTPIGLKDQNGKDLTVGAALRMTAWQAMQNMEGGAIEEQLDRIEAAGQDGQ